MVNRKYPGKRHFSFLWAKYGLEWPRGTEKAGVSSGPEFGEMLAQQPAASAAVVHVELNRMRGHFGAHVFFHFELDIAVDLVVAEHAALLEEVTVLVQGRQGFTEQIAHVDCVVRCSRLWKYSNLVLQISND